MGRYTVSLEEYLDHILRKAHVHFTFDVLVRYGVVVVVCADMVVILYGGYFPGRKFIWVRRRAAGRFFLRRMRLFCCPLSSERVCC